MIATPDDPRNGDDGSLSYRGFFTFHQQAGTKARVLAQLQVWLREKGWAAQLDRTTFEQRGANELFVLHHDTHPAGSTRVRLREQSASGEWRTELTLSNPLTGDGWLALTVTNNRGNFVAVPRVTDYLLDTVEAHDGPAVLTSRPVSLSPAGIDPLLEELCSPEREGLVFVAGTGPDSALLTPFREKLVEWTKEVRGLSRVVVLDPPATAELERELGPSHAVRPWTVRTFQPMVDPAVELDGRRHRILGIATLARRPDDDLARLLGRAARSHAAARKLPNTVLTVSRMLARLETQAAVSALAPTVSIEDDLSRPDSPARGDRPTVPDLDPISSTARIRRQLEEQQARIDILEDEIAFYREYAEDEEFNGALAVAESTRLADENRWLRARLSDRQDYAAAFGKIPDSAYARYPKSFEELFDQVPELETQGVIITADRRKAAELDDHDSLGKLVRAAWDALLALCAYLRARRTGACESSLDGYLARTPMGYRTIPPKKFASTETSRTMDAFGGERRFPVPVSVDRSGTAVMKAHVKLGRVGMVSPRLYLLDRYGSDGKVYVGYIGEHLTNTHSR